MYSCPIIAICSVGLANVPAVADLTASITADTWIAAHTPTLNFNGGIQGSASIDGNDPGGWLRYVIEGSDFYARAAILQFQLPILPANQTITGVRLSLFDTEMSETPNANALVGWITGSTPIVPLLTYNDLAEPGFSGQANDIGALDQAAMQIKYDPDKVQFSDQLANLEILSGTPHVDPYPVYEDLNTSDGLAKFVTDQINNNQPVKIQIVLSPTASSDMIALIHGSDSATVSAASETNSDPIGNLADLAFYPKLEILTDNILLAGDANKDGLVTGADLISVQQNFGVIGTVPMQGDANNDGLVTGADLISVQQNYGIAPASPPLPEPATLGLLGLSALLVAGRPRN